MTGSVTRERDARRSRCVNRPLSPVPSDLERVPPNLDGRESVPPKIERWGPGVLRRAADVVRRGGRVYLTGPSSSPGCASGMSRMASRVY